MATAYITNAIEYRGEGGPLSLYQGTSGAQRPAVPLSLTVTGEIVRREDNDLSDATGVNLWSGSNPATFVYMYFWCNKAVDLQFFGASMQFSIRTTANVSMILPSDDIVIGNNTTELAADPTTENMAKIRLWNSSGATAKYNFALIL